MPWWPCLELNGDCRPAFMNIDQLPSCQETSYGFTEIKTW